MTLAPLEVEWVQPMVEWVTLTLPRLPRAFDGLRVAVIADLHAGARRGGPEGVAEVIQAANHLRPDLVLLPGDVFHSSDDVGQYMPLLADLRPRVGAFACLGNHEHGVTLLSRFVGARPGLDLVVWRRLYAEVAVDLLVNESRRLGDRQSRIWLVGVDDSYSGRASLDAALVRVPRRDFSIVITHSPDLADDPAIGEVDLVVCGHTHGGQVRLPHVGALYTAARRPRERSSGLVTVGETMLYISRGAGEGIPLRINCPRELTLLTLRCAEAGSGC